MLPKHSLIMLTALVFECLAATTVTSAEPTRASGGQYCWKALTEGMGKQDTGLAVVDPSIAARGSDHLWVAWHENAAVQVRRWSGRAWEEMPGPGKETYDAVIRLTNAGVPVLAWRANEGRQSKIYVGRWDGKSWKLLGSPLSAYPEPFTNANSASMVLDPSGYPIVAWQEAPGTGPRSLHVARWNGEVWSLLGMAVATGSDIYSLEPSLSLAGDGSLWLTWDGGTKAHSFVRVARWTGTAWKDVGNTESGILHRGNEVRGPQLVLLLGGQALLVWLERGKEENSLELESWTGRAWEPVAPPPPVPNSTIKPWLPSLALADDGTPLLAWTEMDATKFLSVYVQRLLPTGWQSILSKMHLDPGQSDANDVQLATVNGEFFLIWDEPDDRGQRIRVILAHPCAPGELPAAPPPLRPLESFWPKTVDAAVDDIVSKLKPESKATIRSTRREDLIRFHHGWGTGIRNKYGLWQGNTSLLESCGAKDMHPDSCSMIIIERVWERLNQSHSEQR